MSTIKLVVKANVVPVRTLTLKKLLETFGVKGVVIPRLEDSGEASSFVVGVDADSIATLWQKFVNILKAAVKEVAEFVDRVNSGREKPVRLDTVLESVGDLISYIYRWLLYRSPSRGLGIYTPHISYLVVALARLVDEGVEADPDIYDMVYAMLAECKKSMMKGEARELADAILPADKRLAVKVASETLCRVLDLFERESVEDLLELLLYTVPADTRPGLNYASLLLHDSLTAAIAFSLALEKAIEKGYDLPPLLLQALRLASLLHDVGKPLSYERHVEKSIEVAKYVLEPLEKLEKYYAGIGSIIELVLALVEKHHAEASECRDHALDHVARIVGSERARELAETLCNALRMGDWFASGLDRVADIVVRSASCSGEEDGLCDVAGRLGITSLARELGEVLARRLGVEDPVQALEIAYKGKHGVKAKKLWSVWSELWGFSNTREILVRLSEQVAKLVGFQARGRLLKHLEGWEAEEKDSGSREPPVSLLLVDIGGVQNSIRETQKLRTLAGASLAIEYITAYGVYRLLNVAAKKALGKPLGSPLPPEAIVFAGGGTLHAILPRSLAEKVRGLLEGDKRLRVEALGLLAVAFPSLVFRVAVARMARVYALTVKEAYDMLFREKVVGSDKTVRGAVGFSKFTEPCKWCYRRPAQLAYHGEEVCIPCLLKYLTSWHLGYTSRTLWLIDMLWEKKAGASKTNTSEQVFNTLWDEIVEAIKGRRFELDPLEKLAEGARGQTLAILKSDGNVMGVFMSGALTPAAYYEKSVRVDSALKKALAAVYRVLGKLVEEKAVEGKLGISQAKRLIYSLYYGYLYAGGDDTLLLLPSHVALPAALLLAYVFTAETGFLASLSVGVAAAHYKQPIWLLLDSAEELLDEAKGVSRAASLEALQSLEKCAIGGAVAYDYAGRGMLTQTKVKTRLEARNRRVKQAGVELGELFRLFGIPGLFYLLALVEKAETENVKLCVPKTIADDKKLEGVAEEILKKSVVGVEARELLGYINRLTARVWPTTAIQLAVHYDVEKGDDETKRQAWKLVAVERMVGEKTKLGMLFEELYLLAMLSGGSA